MNGLAPDSSDEKASFHHTDNINKGKEKEQEDVLPYLQNAILEQQSVESGPLPIQRLDVFSTATASSITTTSSTTASPKSDKQGGEDVLPYLQNAVLEQHIGGGEKQLQIQRLDGSLSDSAPGIRSPRSGPPALASAFGTAASTTTNSGGGKGAAAAAPPLVMLRHQLPPLASQQQQLQQPTTSASAFASSASSSSSAASSVIFAAQQPPPFDHHHALSTTVAAASISATATGAPSVLSAHHVADDQYHQVADHHVGHHAVVDAHHAVSGFDSHIVDHHVVDSHHAGGGFDGHAFGAGAHHQAMPSIGAGISRSHLAADASSGFDSHMGHGGHALADNSNHHAVGGHHIADSHHIVGHHVVESHGGGGFDGHAFGAGAGGHADLHHAQSPLSAHHVVDALPAQAPSHHAIAADYNYGGGHHVPGFVSSAVATNGGGPGPDAFHHVSSPPPSFRSGGFVPVAAAAAGSSAGVGGNGSSTTSPPRASVVAPTQSLAAAKPPPVAVLVLLLIVIPVLSLSPYWGYHGPSTVSAFMMDEFGISYLDLGLMFSLYSLPNLFMPFIAGGLIEKWGLSVSSLLFNIFCLLGNILLAITYYMPEKPISLLLISRVVFGFGGEAIIMCQQVMLARWFSGTLLVVASGFVQIFVLCLGSGGAFLFLPHFDEDGVNISLLHVLFVSFWGFVFNLFYVALEWKWTPFLITKFLSERQSAAKVLEGNILPLSRPTTTSYVPVATAAAALQTVTAASQPTSYTHVVDSSLPDGGHLALAPADGGVGFGGRFVDGHHVVDNHHVPAVDTHHALFGGGSVGGGCMGGGGHGGHHTTDFGHHVVNDSAHHVADFGHFDGHAVNGGGHLDLHHGVGVDSYSHAPPPVAADSHFAQPTPRIPSSPATLQTGATAASIGDVEDWGYFRIEGRAQILTRDGREEWDNVTIEGGGRIGRQGGRRLVADAPSPDSLVSGLRNRFFRNPSPAAAAAASASTSVVAAAPSPAPSAKEAALLSSSPILFYPRVFTSKTVGEDLQSLPLVYWLVACMLFCVAPVLPAFTAFAPLFLQDKFGLGAVASSRAASLVYCVGAGAPFAAFLLAKLRVRSFVQLLTLGGVASFLLAFYFCGDDGFFPWFFMAGLGLLYCFVLANGYAWVELTVPRELLGTATALSLAITNAGMALAPFLVGLLREVSSDFDSALIALLGFVAAGFFFASLVLAVDISGQGVLIGADPETVEAERAERRRLLALKRALLDAEDAQVRQREREAVEELEIEAEVRAEVEREVRRRRTERAQQRLQQQQPLPLATAASPPPLGSPAVVTSSSSTTASSSSSSSSALSGGGASSSSSLSSRAAERTPLLSSPQQRPRPQPVTTTAGNGKRV